MCIAIYAPAGKILTRETLETCFKNNGHGCGFAYINESSTEVRKIFIKKTLDFETFYRQYSRAVRINTDSPFLIHFRIKTHGKVDKANCHPFSVDDETAFIHNGVITGVGIDPDKSDTRLFNEKVLQKLPDDWMFNEGIRKLVEDFISTSKIVAMNIDGDVTIFNEEKGVWDGGIWFSNTSYKERVVYYPPARTVTTGKRTYSIWSYHYCDDCNTSTKINDLSTYYDQYGAVIGICSKCKDKRVKDKSIEKLVHAQKWELINELEEVFGGYNTNLC